MTPLWLQIVNKEIDISNEPEMTTLTRVNSSILDQVIASGPSVVNEDFKKVNVSGVNPLFLVALLRSTFSWKDSMPEWFVLRDNVIEEFKNKDLKYQVILRGLI